jgi:mRNA-degrading endonuclease toxin of MazEF toxin-antitoxin module
MVRSCVPDAGDIVWIRQAVHEQAGHRPTVVLSPVAYNAKTSLMVCCPMTRQIRISSRVRLAGSEVPSRTCRTKCLPARLD